MYIGASVISNSDIGIRTKTQLIKRYGSFLNTLSPNERMIFFDVPATGSLCASFDLSIEIAPCCRLTDNGVITGAGEIELYIIVGCVREMQTSNERVVSSRLGHVSNREILVLQRFAFSFLRIATISD